MQLNDMQELVSKLKENTNMQVEATTLGKFFGDSGDKLSMVLGKEILQRPVIISVKQDGVQIIDITSGFVISFSNPEEGIQKLLETFAGQKKERPTIVTSFDNSERVYKDVLAIDNNNGMTTEKKLYEFKQVMYKSGSLDDRMALVRKTIKVLECHKPLCATEFEKERIKRSQAKLSKIVTHVSNKKLAPGQIPSVYEIAIWDWVN